MGYSSNLIRKLPLLPILFFVKLSPMRFSIYVYIFLLFSNVLFPRKAFAKTYQIDFTPQSSVFSHDNILAVTFEYELINTTESDFIVRPISSQGVISIWDSSVDQWVPGNTLWQHLPVLQKEMRVKIENLRESTTEIYFQIQNIKHIQIYETLKRKVWNKNVFEDYVGLLNDNVMGGAERSVEFDEGEQDIVRLPNDMHIPDVISTNRTAVVVGIILFVITAFLGFVWDNAKIIKWRF